MLQAVAQDGLTPLSSASFCGHAPEVRRLLTEPDVDPNRRDSQGRSPLALAAEEGHSVTMFEFLSFDVVKLGDSDSSGNTPLSSAAANGHLDVVKQLLTQVSGLTQWARVEEPPWLARPGHRGRELGNS